LRDRAQHLEGSKAFYLTVIFFLIIFSGCAKKEAVRNISEEDVLRERVMVYWDHKIKQEFDKSYEYEDPLFKKKVNMVNYIKGFNIGKAEWSGAKIEGLKIENESAIVDMKIKLRIIAGASGNIEHDTLVKEKWVKVDGVWYHIPQKFKERHDTN